MEYLEMNNPNNTDNQNCNMPPVNCPYIGKRPWRKRRGCMWTMIIMGVLYIAMNVGLVLLIKDLLDDGVTLEDNTVYHLEMKGTVIEQSKEDNPFEDIMQDMPIGDQMNEKVGLDQLLSNIRLAKTDDRIRGIYLDGGSFNIGLASARYLREALLDFKTSGKFIIAYAEHYNCLSYYIATAADQLYLDPVGTLDWHGFASVKLYYPQLLQKLGIKMNVMKVGTYKSAVEPYICNRMSKQDKEQTLQFLSSAWQTVCREVGERRGISVQHLNDYADLCMEMQPQQSCVDYHMVDGLMHRYDMYTILEDAMGTKDYHIMSTETLAEVERETSDTEEKIAVLYAEGEITDEEGEGIVGTKMLRTIHQIQKNDNVKAVVLRVNSPGGSATASEQIWYALECLQKTGLPVVVSMGDYAASGGYYISCGADYIYAEPTTLTGSIGIFGLVPDLSGLRQKIGVGIDGVGTNKLADSHMLLKGMTRDEIQLMQALVERGYELFTSRCAEGRGMSQDAIKEIAEGRVWTGNDAVRLGLVDSLGSLDDAINKAAELAGIKHYTMAYYPEQKSFWDELVDAFDSNSDEEELLMRLKQRFSKSRVMALMPEQMIY